MKMENNEMVELQVGADNSMSNNISNNAMMMMRQVASEEFHNDIFFI